MPTSAGEQRAFSRFDLTGTVAWVPGGAGALGGVIALGLAEHGAHVVVSGRSLAKAAKTAKTITGLGLSAEAVELDVTDAPAVEAQAEAIRARHGRLDSCVNLAYRVSGASFADITPAEWDEGQRVSSLGAFLVARAAARVMTNGGSIVQFSSMYGVVSPDPANYPESQPVNPVDYGFAKAGILQLVRYQAVAEAKRGIRVNAIVPGPFPGPLAQSDTEFIGRLANRVPLGRVGTADELIGAAVFLCSPSASFVTGTQIVVDGGWTAW